jgi:hypothetical protein
MNNYGDDWTAEEIEICVKAYADAVKAGGTKKDIKKDVFLFRAVKQLPGRNEGSVVRRMGNITHVLVSNGGNPVLGWKALQNVGPTNTVRIRDELKNCGLI